MECNTIKIGFDTYEITEHYDPSMHYDYALDSNGNIYRCCYGHDGDEDWYITCYECITDDELFRTDGDIMRHLVFKEREPYQLIYDFDLREVEGLTLSFEKVGDITMPCFLKYDENKLYVLTR